MSLREEIEDFYAEYSEVIDGGAWGEDIPENIAPVMQEFFHSQ